MRAVLLTFVLLLSACASSRGGWRMPDSADNDAANPDPASYGADAMTFRKDMPHRPDPPAWEFYYKHCSVNGNEAYFSKTSYDCSLPYY